MVKRHFVKGAFECPFRCQYCFAEFACYRSLPNLISEVQNIRLGDENYSLVYPSCDSEVSTNDKYLTTLLEFAKENSNKHRYVIFDFSTKRSFSEREIERLSSFDKELRSINCFLKMSVSVSTKNNIPTIETGTSSYEERVSFARSLTEIGINFSLTIKPILPFVSIDEYIEIVSDFSKYTKFFLTGNLYVDEKTSFGNKMINDYPDAIVDDVAEWHPSKPVWKKLESTDKINRIREYISSLGCYHFDSDADLVESMVL